MKEKKFSYKTVCIIFFFFLFSVTSHAALQEDIKFHHLTLEQGLSQSIIYSIFQDSRGFMWFGTEDGLNLYDGCEFEVFRNKSDDIKSLSYNYIKSIVEDESGFIWIGTYGRGLNRYDPAQQTFSRFHSKSPDAASLSSDFINSMCLDGKGNLWIATDDGLNRFDLKQKEFTVFKNEPSDPQSMSHNRVSCAYLDHTGSIWAGTADGLNRYEIGTERFTRFQNDPSQPLSLSSNSITCILETQSVELWIGTENGLNKYDPDKNAFTRYFSDEQDPHSLTYAYIYSLYEDSEGVLWVGTQDGLNRYVRANNHFVQYKLERGNPNSLSDNEIYSLYEDRTGVFWVGTRRGINKFNKYSKRFFHYYFNPHNPSGLNSNHVRSLLEDRSGDIWIGTYNGLDVFDRSLDSFAYFTADQKDPSGLSNDRVMSLCQGSSGIIWIGTYGGLDKFDPQKKIFTYYRHDPSDPGSLSDNSVRCVYKDRNGVLWVGTTNGLNQFIRDEKRFIHYFHDPQDNQSLCSDYIYSIYEDSQGTFWVGTLDGLNIYDLKSRTFKRFQADPHDPDSLSNNEILCIFEDSSGVMWFGTPGGLNRYHPESGRFSFFTEKDGLPNDLVYAILEDETGNLWMSTNKGLSRFNPRTQKFRNYDVEDGLQCNEFNLGAALKTSKGEMFFGGINGFNRFFPDDIKDNPYIPPVVITDFQIFNKSVPIGDGPKRASILTQAISMTDQIKLSYNDRVITFEFAALHFAAPEKNRYSHQLEGFEQDWNYVGTRRFATYTNLSPGKYVFRVKGSNNDGLWNEEGASLSLIIFPPFWRTWWFRGLALSLVIVLLVGFYITRTHNIRMRAQELERRVENRTAELGKTNTQLQQEIREKIQAEYSVSQSLKEKEVLLQEIHHRVKNNMQIISSLLNLQARQIKDKEISGIFRICQNRIRSMALIHQKLYQSEDFSRIDFSGYIRSLTENLFSIYEGDAENIDFKMNLDKVYLNINQAVPLGLITNELVSNSLKHAFPEKSSAPQVTIVFETDDKESVTLMVSDNGVGLPSGFDLKNVDSLGLKLIQNLVTQLNGSLEMGGSQGACFKISFQLEK